MTPEEMYRLAADFLASLETDNLDIEEVSGFNLAIRVLLGEAWLPAKETPR